MGDRLKAWLLYLDYSQRRALVGVGVAVVVLGLVLGIASLTGGDDGGGEDLALQTDDDGSSTSTTDPEGSTSSSAALDLVDGSSSTTVATGRPTTTVKGASTTRQGGTSTTRRSGGGGGGTSTTTTQAPSTTAGATADAGSATTVSNLYGGRRDELGNPRLSRKAALDQVAASWAAHLAAQGPNGQLAHQEPATIAAACSATCEAAENVARHQTAQGAWTTWLGSSQHVANIDDPRCGEYGVAAYRTGGDIYFVHVFGFYATCP